MIRSLPPPPPPQDTYTLPPSALHFRQTPANNDLLQVICCRVLACEWVWKKIRPPDSSGEMPAEEASTKQRLVLKKSVKISLFVSGEQIIYLPMPKTEARRSVSDVRKVARSCFLCIKNRGL